MLITFAAFVNLVYASFFEWFLHKYLMHERVTLFSYPYETHAITHHQVFRSDESYHLGSRGSEIAGKIPMAWWNGPAVVLIGTLIGPVPVYLLIFGVSWAVLPWVGLSLLIFILDFAAYEYFHFCMHKPTGRWFEDLGWYKRLNAHHLLHHKFPQKNFNTVFLFADLLFGTLLKESPRTFEQAGSPVPNVQPKK